MTGCIVLLLTYGILTFVLAVSFKVCNEEDDLLAFKDIDCVGGILTGLFSIPARGWIVVLNAISKALTCKFRNRD